MIRIIAILLFISLFSLHSEPLASKAWSGTMEDEGRLTAVSDEHEHIRSRVIQKNCHSE